MINTDPGLSTSVSRRPPLSVPHHPANPRAATHPTRAITHPRGTGEHFSRRAVVPVPPRTTPARTKPPGPRRASAFHIGDHHIDCTTSPSRRAMPRHRHDDSARPGRETASAAVDTAHATSEGSAPRGRSDQQDRRTARHLQQPSDIAAGQNGSYPVTTFPQVAPGPCRCREPRHGR